MQMVKIKIPDQAQSASAMLELARRGRIDCYPQQVFMVPEPALATLRDLRIAFEELGRGGIDYAEKTLRDSLTRHAQRRHARGSRKTPAHTR